MEENKPYIPTITVDLVTLDSAAQQPFTYDEILKQLDVFRKEGSVIKITVGGQPYKVIKPED